MFDAELVGTDFDAETARGTITMNIGEDDGMSRERYVRFALGHRRIIGLV